MTIKATSELLLRTLDSDVNPAIKAERLQRFRGLIGAVEDTFGKNHRYVRVWRAIHSIGKAELDGTPQPDDKELGLNAKCFVATVLLRIGRLPRSSKASSLSRSGHATAPEWTAFVPLYYCLGPVLANWLVSRPRCRGVVRRYLIEPVVNRLPDVD